MNAARCDRPEGATAMAISSLQPRTSDGTQFVLYGDCCSGVPRAPYAANFAAVNGVVSCLRPAPEFILFAGDHVYGMTPDYDALRGQWRHWHDQEMAWLDPAIPHYPSTSNHNTYDAGSETVWREVFADLPRNGPPGQEGLSYFVRRGPLLLVSVNTSFSALGGAGHVECQWLDRVLAAHAEARWKLVFGHYPAHPVNGYARYPLWRIVPDQARAFWDVLVRRGVFAYLCSHIIAFDAQAHDGVLQVCSGGAGTNYGPGGFMPGPEEYLHAVQAALDGRGLRYRTLDASGTPREWLSWPIAEPSPDAWRPLAADWVPWPAPFPEAGGSEAAVVRRFRFSGTVRGVAGERQTLLCGWNKGEQRATLEVALDHGDAVVDLVPRPGDAPRRWRSRATVAARNAGFELALHPAMGPGGLLFRAGPDAPWTSLDSAGAIGMAQMPWPDQWRTGTGASGADDAPFRGRNLIVTACATLTGLEE